VNELVGLGDEQVVSSAEGFAAEDVMDGETHRSLGGFDCLDQDAGKLLSKFQERSSRSQKRGFGVHFHPEYVLFVYVVVHVVDLPLAVRVANPPLEDALVLLSDCEQVAVVGVQSASKRPPKSVLGKSSPDRVWTWRCAL
jgi:hypothetical protein